MEIKIEFDLEKQAAFLNNLPNPPYEYLYDNEDPKQGLGLSMDSKKISKKRNKYQRIDDNLRQLLIDAVVKDGLMLKTAAKRFKINYSSAKSIFHTYKKEGRINKKTVRDRYFRTAGIKPENEDPLAKDNTSPSLSRDKSSGSAPEEHQIFPSINNTQINQPINKPFIPPFIPMTQRAEKESLESQVVLTNSLLQKYSLMHNLIQNSHAKLQIKSHRLFNSPPQSSLDRYHFSVNIPPFPDYSSMATPSIGSLGLESLRNQNTNSNKQVPLLYGYQSFRPNFFG